MRHATAWTLACCGMLALNGQAEPAHKTAARPVDLEAAARATAALYTTPMAPEAMPAATAARALQRVQPLPVTPPAQRPSPLLPAAAAVAPVPANASVAVASAPGDVFVGSYHCELSERVSLRPGAAPDQVELQWKNQRWNLRRTDSRSGAMRLEDASARMVWLQLANKSMLLDQRQGRRLLDECQHDVQVQTAAQMKTNPPPALFDTNGMGR